MRRKRFLFAVLFFVTLSFSAAQSSGSVGITDARSMGMAKTFTTSSFGIYALGRNPANLIYDQSKNVEVVLPFPLLNIGAAVGSNFISIDEYNYFFGQKNKDEDGKTVGRLLTENDKNRLKDLFADGGSVLSDLQILWFALSIKPAELFGTLAFSVSDNFSGNMTFPKGIIDLGLEGNLPNKVYNFSDAKLKMWWLRKYSFSYARNLNLVPALFKNFSIGFSVNMVQGFIYVGLDRINTELKTGEANVITGKGEFLAHAAFSPDFKVRYNFDKAAKNNGGSFSPFPAPAGSGIGFDFGINAKLNEFTSIGFSVTDIGSINWNKNVAQFSTNALVYLDDLTDQAQRDTLVNRLTGKESGKYINSVSTQLATALHFGVGLQLDKMFGSFPGKMLLAADLHQGFNEQPLNSKKPRVSFGIDWSFASWIALRTGLSFGGNDNFNLGAGLGFNFGLLELNFGLPDFHYLLSPNKAKRITLAADSRWKF